MQLKLKKNFVFALGTVMVNYLLILDEDKLNCVIHSSEMKCKERESLNW